MIAFERALAALRRDRERGAAELARQALEALAAYAQTLAGEEAATFSRELRAAAARLAACRPTMAAVGNWGWAFVHRCEEALEGSPRPQLVREVAEALLAEQASLPARLVEAARPFLLEVQSVITLSRSSTVERLLLEAAGPGLEVTALESRPACEGRTLAAALHGAGRRVRLITEAQLALFLPRAELVLVGADAICADLTVINKTGTHVLCALARHFGVPVAVAADTFKLQPKIEGAQAPLERGDPAEVWPERPELCEHVVFEPTPGELVDHFVTEKGVLSPRALRRELGRLRRVRSSCPPG